MKKQVLCCVAAALLAGCASAPQTVLVPTPIPCPAAADDKRPARPGPTLSNLDASQPDAVAKAYASSRVQWQGYADALETLLDACK
jgi:uncharacterized lipoprotein YajG